MFEGWIEPKDKKKMCVIVNGFKALNVTKITFLSFPFNFDLCLYSRDISKPSENFSYESRAILFADVNHQSLTVIRLAEKNILPWIHADI